MGSGLTPGIDRTGRGCYNLRMLHLLNNKTFILALAFVTGLVFSDVAGMVGVLTMPALALVLTVSTTQVTIKDFLPLGRMVRPVSMALVFNYLLLSTLIIILAWWLMPTRDLLIGYILLAAAPPGIAIIPFSHILKGDIRTSILGTFGVYLLSIFLTPLIIFIFTGEASVSPLRLINTMAQLILLPFILSQVIRATKLNHYVSKYRGNIINWGFFVVIFTVVGLNREIFLSRFDILLPVSVVAIVSSFGLSFLVELICRKFKVPEDKKNSYMLLSSIKTSAFAAAVGLSLFSEAASIPGAVISAWYALYFIYLGIRGNRLAGNHKKKHLTGNEIIP